MPRQVIAVLLGLAALLLIVPAAQANIMDIYGFGPRASAMGMAFTGLADDESAIYYNPAGLAQLDKSSISFTYFMAQPNLNLNLTPSPAATLEERAAISRMSRQQEDVTPINGYNLGAAIKIKKWFGVGLGIYMPEGLVIRLEPPTSRLPTFALHENYSQRAVALAAVAFRPIAGLSFGGGVSLFAQVDGRMNVPLELNNDNVSLDPEQRAANRLDPLSTFTIEFPLSVWPFAGIQWKPAEWVSLGLSYRSHFQWDVDMSLEALLTLDHFTLDLADLERLVPDLFPIKTVISIDIPNLGQPIEVPVEISAIEGELEIMASIPLAASISIIDFWKPQQVTLGAAFKPWERVTLTVDGVWFNWSQMPRPDMKLEVEDVRINLSTLPATLRGHIESLSIPILGTIGPLPPIDIKLPGIDLELLMPLDFSEAYAPRTRDIIVPRLGAEYRLGPFPRIWLLGRVSGAVRAGYSYSPTPFAKPNGYTNLIATDRHIATGGFGFTVLELISLDFYGQYHHLMPVEAKRDYIDPDFPYTKLKAGGYLLAGGASVKIIW